MPSAKDKCFKKAVSKLKDNGKLKDVNIQDQQRYVRDRASGQWSQTGDVWYKVVGAISRLRKWLARGLPVGEGPVIDATNIPDTTVTRQGGKPVVIDNKFDQKVGRDTFTEEQLERQNKINQQQNGDPAAKDLRLDADVCKCGEEGALDPVPVPQEAPLGIRISPYLNPSPGTRVPELGPAVRPGVPVRGVPLRPLFGAP